MKAWFRSLPPVQRTAAGTVGVVLVMGSLGWASVPLYDLFCRVTGYGGTTSQAEQGSDRVLDRTVTVRFDASTDRDMPWTFKPVERTMTVRLGETGLAFYEAHNPTDQPVAGTASYNVAPYAAGLFFTKIDCFCFEMQVLQPGESVMMPVTFFVDPDMVDDREAKYLHTITLSYTFYQTDLPDAQQAQLAPDADQSSVN
jgi:cytochrome c oxidase assembly protein subunit 11